MEPAAWEVFKVFRWPPAAWSLATMQPGPKDFPGSMPKSFAGGHGAGKVFKVFHGGRKSLKSSHAASSMPKTLKTFVSLRFAKTRGTGLSIFLERLYFFKAKTLKI
jgi:hypothetical protein